MTDYSKGGRGKKAPYETVHYRIPQPIKPTVEMLAERYRKLVTTESSVKAEELLKRVHDSVANELTTENKPGTKFTKVDLEQIITLLQDGLKLKANAGGKIKERIREALELLEKLND
jgi:hypothetical protein